VGESRLFCLRGEPGVRVVNLSEMSTPDPSLCIGNQNHEWAPPPVGQNGISIVAKNPFMYALTSVLLLKQKIDDPTHMCR